MPIPETALGEPFADTVNRWSREGDCLAFLERLRKSIGRLISGTRSAGLNADLVFIVPQVIRLEWVHAVAAVHRWQEEIRLLREESRRVHVSFGKEADLWGTVQLQDLSARQLPPQAITGFQAHTRKKVTLFRDLAVRANSYFVSL